MATGTAWRAWYEANRERYNAYQREYARAHRPERVLLTAEQRGERRRESVRRWREAHPDLNDASIASINANRRPESRALGQRITTQDVLALWQRQPVCVECGAGRGVDHVVRLGDGGPNTPDNLQNLCKPCNGRKENAGRALAPDHPNFERARKARERRHRATTGINAR